MAAIFGGVISLIGALAASDAASGSAGAAQAAAQLQWDIADRVQKRAEYLFDLWKTEYKDCELALKDEICALTPYTVQYDTAAARAVTQVRRMFTKARRDALACLDTRCVGAYCGLSTELAVAEAGAAAWAANAVIRSEDEKKRVIDQQNRENKYKIAALGHQAYFNDNASALAAGIYGQQAAAARSASSSNMSAAGYFLQRAMSNFGLDNQRRSSLPGTGDTGTGTAAGATAALQDYQEPSIASGFNNGAEITVNVGNDAGSSFGGDVPFEYSGGI